MHACIQKKEKGKCRKGIDRQKKKDKYVDIEIQDREATKNQSYGQTERESDRQADRWID